VLQLSKVVTQLVLPLGLAIAAMLGAAGLAWRRGARAASALAAGAALALWAASLPVAAYRLLSSIEARHAPVAAEKAPSAGAIVVLGGGLRAFDPTWGTQRWPDLNAAGDRLIHAARLYRAGKAPLVIPTGGPAEWEPDSVPQAELAVQLLEEWGVPRAAIVPEPRSRTTWEDARRTREILAARGIHEVLLVTSALHMERALASFEAAGVRAIPAPTDYEAEAPPRGLLGWLPSVAALSDTTRSLREWLGLAVYRLRARIEVEGPERPTGTPHRGA
jgi:uncharacterized SAM-binding protein YcdF (DUF218 family)